MFTGGSCAIRSHARCFTGTKIEGGYTIWLSNPKRGYLSSAQSSGRGAGRGLSRETTSSAVGNHQTFRFRFATDRSRILIPEQILRLLARISDSGFAIEIKNPRSKSPKFGMMMMLGAWLRVPVRYERYATRRCTGPFPIVRNPDNQKLPCQVSRGGLLLQTALVPAPYPPKTLKNSLTKKVKPSPQFLVIGTRPIVGASQINRAASAAKP
jgi:hypothetical protein